MITYSIAQSDYTFNVSVSTTTYESKEAFVAASKKLVYRKQPVNIGSMCQLIKEGHSFCHCYDDNDEPFTNSTKTQANFRYTSCIAYDIDDNTLTMEEYLTGNTKDRQGTRTVEVSSSGKVVAETGSTPAQQGDSVMLTLDLGLQTAAEEALKKNMLIPEKSKKKKIIYIMFLV